jgi:hypothetical protein
MFKTHHDLFGIISTQAIVPRLPITKPRAGCFQAADRIAACQSGRKRLVERPGRPRKNPPPHNHRILLIAYAAFFTT